jgi:magnesium transporter
MARPRSSTSLRRPRKRPPPGARPGTLVVPEGALAPRIRLMRYDRETVEERDVSDPAALEPLIGAGRIAWVDVQGLGDERLLRRLGELFGLHALALEDVVHVGQRPKTEAYEGHQFYVSRMFRRLPSRAIDREQVSIFFGKHYVLTFQERYGDVLDPVRERLRQGKGPMRKSGPDYLAYAIIDAIIDGYYPVLEATGDTLEDLEHEVIAHATPTTLQRIHDVKRELLALRRGIWPQRDAINSLIRDDLPFVSKEVRIYLRDCYDHCVQLSDLVETYRELVSGLLGTYLSSIANRTNEVMKVLTIMASIFIPLTFLAGIFGMNFERMPELGIPWAYPALLGLMVVVALGMLVYFRRLGWIGGGGQRHDEDEETA